MTSADIIGYASSFIVLISFLMTSVIRLRIINFVGCILFTIYGIMIHAYPVAGINFAIGVIQIVFLCKLLKTKSGFRIVKCFKHDMFLRDFVNMHTSDIKQFLPAFDLSSIPDDAICYFCLVNEELAGLWIGVRHGTVLEIILDYVKEKFRDCSMGNYIYTQNSDMFKNEGFSRLEAKGIFGTHAEYLMKVGFSKTAVAGDYELAIK